jgi:hypothetical protein
MSIMSISKRVVGVSLSLLACAVARAEPPKPVPIAYGFDDELVQGDLPRSDAEVLQTRRRMPRASLVEVRASYLPELLASVEDL